MLFFLFSEASDLLCCAGDRQDMIGKSIYNIRASGFGLRASGFGLRASGFGLRFGLRADDFSVELENIQLSVCKIGIYADCQIKARRIF
ncbi:MAG: hypothetical protein LC116_10640 [Bacteroidetes bacterium]|nr:hypothetical protein [Bacteroidota bacterium]